MGILPRRALPYHRLDRIVRHSYLLDRVRSEVEDFFEREDPLFRANGQSGERVRPLEDDVLEVPSGGRHDGIRGEAEEMGLRYVS